MPRGRYAPSPTGTIHLGNASTALLAWLSVRSRGGDYVMRMEDLDAPRVVAGSAEAVLADLEWLGLDWDEGPDRGGPYAPYVQSERLEGYERAFAALRAGGRVYPCFCSRKDIQAAASAPQAPGDETSYPGTCRALSDDEAASRIAAGTPHAWRFHVKVDDVRGVDDTVYRRFEPGPGSIGDFVVRRADGVAAYQLAVVVDDAAMKIDDIVRGDDLLPSAVRQNLIYAALGWDVPAYAHVPLLLGGDGVRLSKRHRGVTLAEVRQAGMSAETVVGKLAAMLGLRPTPEPVSAQSLIDGFDWSPLQRRMPGGLVVSSFFTGT